MPRYYFNLRNDLNADDEEGTELPDERAAHQFALTNARGLVCEDITAHGSVDPNHFIEVTDEDGRSLFRLTFGEAFTVSG